MNFRAIDVETANADLASICQIGIAAYENGVLIKEWKTYVDPEDYFDSFNVSVHGIDGTIVNGAPTFPAIAEVLREWLEGNVVVCHTHFDRTSLHQVAMKYDIPDIKCEWLDSARVARRTWEQCAWKAYGLHKVCNIIGYEFQHHDALEDAKAAAQVLLAASEITGLDIDGWFNRIEQPIDPSTSQPIIREANPEGPFFGEVLVITGQLELPRRQMADIASSLGFNVASGVTKKTTILVVGDQDIRKLAGHKKSSKHRKADDLIAKGVNIRILRESDFKELARQAEDIAGLN